MAGLLGDVLPYLYGRGNVLRRGLLDFAQNPLESLQQTAGLLVDKGREQQNVLAKAFSDQREPFKVTDRGALDQATMNVLAGPLGFAPVGMMAGVNAATANKAMLAKAQQLEQSGANPADIWQQTGWGKGPDGMWRFEIDDTRAGMRLTGPKFGDSESVQKMGETFDHRELYKAYPSAKKIGSSWWDEAGAGYSSSRPSGGMENITLPRMAGPDSQRSSALHEMQHAIQTREDFARGGAPSMFTTPQARAAAEAEAKKLEAAIDAARDAGNRKLYDQLTNQRSALMSHDGVGQYKRLAGEAEARLVQARANMTPEARSATFPWDPRYFEGATGVPLNSLIIRR
jgi:hypothetical protein